MIIDIAIIDDVNNKIYNIEDGRTLENILGEIEAMKDLLGEENIMIKINNAIYKYSEAIDYIKKDREIGK